MLGSWSVGGADLASSLYGEVGRVAALERSQRRCNVYCVFPTSFKLQVKVVDLDSSEFLARFYFELI